VSRKPGKPGFEQILELLRFQLFEVTPSAVVRGGVAVRKHGAEAILVNQSGAAAFAVAPGALVDGELARLVDRGYQKFMRTSQCELPATASQLQGIHRFSEELKQVTGAIDLYNQSLGTTSDVYLYDRLQGRESARPAPHGPWELDGGE